MALSLALAKQIASMFIILFFGFLTIRLKVLTEENSKGHKQVSYLCGCAQLSNILVSDKLQPEKLTGLLLSLSCVFLYIFYIY
jgi:hypothetical protein